MDFNKKQNYFIFFNYCLTTELIYGDLIVFIYIYIYLYVSFSPNYYFFLFYFLIYLYFRYSEILMRYGFLFVLKFKFFFHEKIFIKLKLLHVHPLKPTKNFISTGGVQNYSPQFKIPRILDPSENSIPKRYHEFCDQRG